MSEDDVNKVKLRLHSFLEDISAYEKSQQEFYACIRTCVALFWVRNVYDFGPNGQHETWPSKKPMPHQEAIQKIKEKVIPLLNKAKSLVVQSSIYVKSFETLCGYIEALFAEKQAGGGGAEEKRRAADERRERVRVLLHELWDLFVKSNA